MRLLIKIMIGLLINTFVLAKGWAVSDEIFNTWFRCNKTSDCILIKGIVDGHCDWVAANQKYAKTAESFFVEKGVDSMCNDFVLKDKKTPDCNKNECVVEWDEWRRGKKEPGQNKE